MKVLLPLLALVACDEPPCVDMTAGEQGLVVTQAEHGLAWGEASCDSCHLRAALHNRGCTPGVDLQVLRDEVAAADDDGVCAACHGTNGGGS